MDEDDLPRITDLSSLEPENFKVRNTAFLLGDSHYDNIYNESQTELRRQIWGVRNGDYSESASSANAS